MQDFTLTVDDLGFVGDGLTRPECVLCARNGTLFASDRQAGVTRIDSSGSRQAFRVPDAAASGIMPNGIAVEEDGSFLLASLGDTAGLFRLYRDGRLEHLLAAVDGVDLPPCNFVLIDHVGRMWLSISTRRQPRHLDYRAGADSGFIVLIDGRGARIVADGIGYTNEVRFDATGEWLYVNETFGRRLSRYRCAADGTLSGRETVATFGHGTYPDGLTMDADGGAWITSVVSNRVIRVAPDGAQHVVLEDKDTEHVDWVERAYETETMQRAHLDTAKGRVLRNISSLAFGGPDLKTAYLGCLLGESIATFRSPVAGVEPPHWSWDI